MADLTEIHFITDHLRENEDETLALTPGALRRILHALQGGHHDAAAALGQAIREAWIPLDQAELLKIIDEYHAGMPPLANDPTDE